MLFIEQLQWAKCKRKQIKSANGAFVLAGEAEISDYYNYNYDDDINEKYASVTIGTYPYSWKLYFERDKYKEFLSKLEEGPMEVIIEAKTEKDRMEPTSTQGIPVKIITEIDEYK